MKSECCQRRWLFTSDIQKIYQLDQPNPALVLFLLLIQDNCRYGFLNGDCNWGKSSEPSQSDLCPGQLSRRSNCCSHKTVFFKYTELLWLQTIFGIEGKLSNFDLILVYEHTTFSYAKNSTFD